MVYLQAHAESATPHPTPKNSKFVQISRSTLSEVGWASAHRWPHRSYATVNLGYCLFCCGCLGDSERLLAQLIADKLKSCLPGGALNCMLSLERNDCFRPWKIAELADTYASNHGEKDIEGVPKNGPLVYFDDNFGKYGPILSRLKVRWLK